MDNLYGNRVSELRKAKGLTQAELAERLGTHFVTVSKIERGRMQLTTTWIERIAQALNVHPGDVFAPPQTTDVIWLYGAIKRGNIAGFDLKKRANRYEIPSDDPEDSASVWIGVADDSMAPFFHWGDALRFTAYYDDIHADSEGRLTFITTEDDRHLLCSIEQFIGDNVFDIRLMSGAIHKALKVKQFRLFTGTKIRALDDETLDLISKFSQNDLSSD